MVVELVGPLVCQGVQRCPGLHLLDAGKHLVTVPSPVVLEVEVVVANNAIQRGSAPVVCMCGVCVCEVGRDCRVNRDMRLECVGGGACPRVCCRAAVGGLHAPAPDGCKTRHTNMAGNAVPVSNGVHGLVVPGERGVHCAQSTPIKHAQTAVDPRPGNQGASASPRPRHHKHAPEVTPRDDQGLGVVPAPAALHREVSGGQVPQA